MHPRAPLTAGDRVTISVWWRRVVVAVVLVAVALFTAPLLLGTSGGPSGAKTAETRLLAACARWDEVAGHAIAQLVVAPGDIDLRRATDVIFRLRRARQNCREGWLRIACQDYQAIILSASGVIESRPGPSVICWSAPTLSTGNLVQLPEPSQP